MGDNLSPADVKAIVGNNNPYPMYGNGFGNGFGGDSGWLWFIIILAMMNGGWGFGGGFGGGVGMDAMYPWLSNGQKEIMQNTNQGFNTLQLGNQLNDISSGVQNISTQLCNGFAGVNQTVSSGFANVESSANARQMADMQQNFALSTQVSNASADNRLGIANLTSTVLAENCADREALSNGIRDIVTNQTANTQRILDQLCQDKIDAKNEKIADLERQLTMADLKASQTAQNAFISQGFADEVDSLYNRLNNCPVPSTPVYGRTPIFTCNGGCGCGNTFGNTLV